MSEESQWRQNQRGAGYHVLVDKRGKKGEKFVQSEKIERVINTTRAYATTTSTGILEKWRRTGPSYSWQEKN